MAVTIAPFGKTADGLEVRQVVLKNGPCELRALTYGATITHLFVPDRAGGRLDVLLGYERLQEYEKGTAYLGALVGRNANRIGDASLTIDGQVWPLAANEGTKQLHGGPNGFSRRVFDAVPEGDNAVRFTLDSPDGDQGYPGAVHLEAVYSLSADGAVTLEYEATATRPTLVNITNHSYFNLAGHDAGPDALLNHTLWLDAPAFTPSDASSLPTGEIRPVAGTPFDFTAAKPLGRDIGADDLQLRQAAGYDHNWVLAGSGLRRVARLVSPDSGVWMELSTTQPGVQIYTGNYLAGGPDSKSGAPYENRGGVALETQFFPDCIHHANFGDPVLRPGQTYRQTTVYRFGLGE